MPVIQAEANISLEQLLKVVAQLPDKEIGRFTEQVIALRAQCIAPSLPENEAALLQRSSQTFPPTIQRRCDELVAKREIERLKPEEYDELLRLSDSRELADADRIAAIAALAQGRQVTLPELLAALGIAPDHDVLYHAGEHPPE